MSPAAAHLTVASTGERDTALGNGYRPTSAKGRSTPVEVLGARRCTLNVD
jgi:hypothetical protein